MSDQAVLSPPLQDMIQQVGTTDIIVGVLTLNNAGTIEQVVKSIVEGLQQAFSGASAIILNCDGGSNDGTSEAVSRVASGAYPVWTISHTGVTYPGLAVESGLPGREESIRSLCTSVQRLQAKACLILEGNIRSMNPCWIDLLGKPVYEQGEDFVVPLYRRHRYEGTLVTNLLYPLTRAMYGKRLRYPSGGGYGLSGKLARELLKKPYWSEGATKVSLDGWMTTVALAEDYRVCHAFLGVKDQETKVGSVDLANVLAQTVGGILASMEEYEAVWERTKDTTDVPLYGTVESAPALIASPVQVGRMLNGFKQGLRDLLPLWELILSPDTLSQVLPLGMQDAEEFRFPSDLWVQTIYDFALAYHDQVLHREHLLKSLTPLYLGRTASFVLETQEGDAAQVERSVESLCILFEQRKPYLVERWRWRDE